MDFFGSFGKFGSGFGFGSGMVKIGSGIIGLDKFGSGIIGFDSRIIVFGL